MAKKIIVDHRYASVAADFFQEKYTILPSCHVEALPEPVCAHPDMALVQVGDTFIAEKTVYGYYKTHLSSVSVLCGETALSGNYPLDIAYNVLISGKDVFANESYMDGVLRSILLEKNYRIYSVKQGYAKCSSAVAENCVITADSTIALSAEARGLHVLRISQGDVRLNGYPYGFIGGASGYIDGILYFFGDITKHSDYQDIKSFLREHQIPYSYIPDFPLTDVGTLIGI